MLLTVLAVSAALAAPTARTVEAPSEVAAKAVMLECLVSGESLTECQVVDPSVTAGEGAEALRMAAQIQVPEALALANPGRIRIKLNVNP